MKFPEGWQVDVVRPRGAGAYADLSHGNIKYVVGIPNQPFEVQVTLPSHVFNSAPIKVNLTVEGQSCGVARIVEQRSPQATFHGFVSTVKGKHVTSQFLFGSAQTDFEAPTSAPGTSKTGGLTIHIELMRQLPGQRAPAAHVSSQAAASTKAIEGKKWFLQPSLSAKAGNVVPGPPMTFSTNIYEHVRMLAELNLKMETAAILVLRKVLDPENPDHQAIIDSSQPPHEPEEGGDESADATATGRSPGDATRGTKRRVKSETMQSNKAVKPEPLPTPLGQRMAGKSDIIDLT